MSWIKRTGRHAQLPRESRGLARRAVKAAASGIAVLAVGVATTGMAAVSVREGTGTAGTPWIGSQGTAALHAVARLRPAPVRVKHGAERNPARPEAAGGGRMPYAGHACRINDQRRQPR